MTQITKAMLRRAREKARTAGADDENVEPDEDSPAGEHDGPTFGEQLREQRLKAKVGATEMARRLQFQRQQVYKIEGCEAAPTETTVRKYAAALGLDVSLKFSRKR